MKASFSIFFLCFVIFQNCFYFSFSSASPLLLPLSHSLSTSKHSSPLNLLKSSSSRSSARFRRHHHKSHKHQHQLPLPLSSGSDYLLSLSIGSSSSVSLYLDTGSDLVWFPCRPFTCILCESKPKPSPAFLSSSAITVPCSSPSCSAAHSSIPSSDLCAIARCPLDFIETGDCATSSYPCPHFYYAYGDGSLVAQLFSDSLSLPPASVTNFTFGCAQTTLAEPIGVAGFGRGRLSLPAQLAAYSPHLGNSFSYCLVSHSFNSERIRQPSPLILGRFLDEKEKRVGTGTTDDEKIEFVYTDLLNNPKHPYFYSVSLQGISIGKRNIPAPSMLRRVDKNGGGGIVVDSGTTFTMLPAKFYNSVVEEFDNRVGRIHERADRVESGTGMSPCYYFNQTVRVPALVLHFAGNGSSVTLPRRNYFYEFIDGGDYLKGEKRKVGCLMLLNGGDESELQGGTGAILGNYQQQGFEVVYDLLNKRVGFAKRKCASLWDTMNQR